MSFLGRCRLLHGGVVLYGGLLRDLHQLVHLHVDHQIVIVVLEYLVDHIVVIGARGPAMAVALAGPGAAGHVIPLGLPLFGLDAALGLCLGRDCPEGLESVLAGNDRFLELVGDHLRLAVGSGRIERQILRDEVGDVGGELKLPSGRLIGQVCCRGIVAQAVREKGLHQI